MQVAKAIWHQSNSLSGTWLPERIVINMDAEKGALDVSSSNPNTKYLDIASLEWDVRNIAGSVCTVSAGAWIAFH